MEVFRTERLIFRTWKPEDLKIACTLWGDPEVMRLLDSRGGLNEDQVRIKLEAEFENLRKYGTQYWPIFETSSGEFVGCCGLKPWDHSPREGLGIGFHLVRKFWGKGLAREAAVGAIRYAFEHTSTPVILAGHHPENHGSKKVLESLGFRFLEYVFFPPTGLQHPSYELSLELKPANKLGMAAVSK